MQTPLEESLTISNEFSEFMTTFPGIYRKISQRLNHSLEVQEIPVSLGTAPTTVHSFDANTKQPFLYFICGSEPSQPIALGCGVSFGIQGGLILPISQSPGNTKIQVSIQSRELVVSLSSGVGLYTFYLLFL